MREDCAPGRPSPAAIGEVVVPGEGVAQRLRSARGGRPLPGTTRRRPKHEARRGGQEAVRIWSPLLKHRGESEGTGN